MTSDDGDELQLDEMLRSSYKPLRQPIAEQRQAVLDGFTQARANVVPMPPVRHAWPARLAWLTAACVVVAVSAKTLLIPSSMARVYGLETVRKRLCEVQTIRVRGHRLVYDRHKPDSAPVRIPIDYAIKRPDKFRFNWWGTSDDNTKIEIRQGTQICDGRQVASRSDAQPQSTARSINPINARLTTEEFGQAVLLSAVMGPPEAPYKKTGAEKHKGRMYDVYEGRFGEADEGVGVTIEKLWFDPVSGYPVRLIRDEIQPDGTARRESEFDEILVNTPLGDELFVVETPPGGKQPPAPADEVPPFDMHPTGAGYGPDAKLEGWYALRITDSAMLVAWRRNAPKANADGTVDWLSGVEMKGPDQLARDTLRHAWIYQSNSPDVWNWSLLVTDHGQLPEPGVVNVQLKSEHSDHTIGMVALRFPDQQLEKILVAAAGAALPEGVSRFTLAQLHQREHELERESKP